MFIFKDGAFVIIFLIYVDDIIVTGNNSSLIQKFISALNQNFALENLGDLSFFLGIQVVCDRHSVHLSQSKYITDLLSRKSKSNYKLIHSPVTFGVYLSLHDGELLENGIE